MVDEVAKEVRELVINGIKAGIEEERFAPRNGKKSKPEPRGRLDFWRRTWALYFDLFAVRVAMSLICNLSDGKLGVGLIWSDPVPVKM